MPKASIIVATFNGEKTIKETIRHLLSQSEKEIEVLVIDDGSTDKTPEIIKKYQDDRLTFKQIEHSGSPAKPRNEGMALAKGDFIGFCDQDDLWYEQKIEKQIAAYLGKPNQEKIGLIITSADLIDQSGRKIFENKLTFSGIIPSKRAYRELLSRNFITASSSVLIPKLVATLAGRLDENLLGVDDYDYWLRIVKDYDILALPETLCAWRQDENSLSANKLNQYIETEKVFEKLESTDGAADVKFGHGKNLMRILTCAIWARNREIIENTRRNLRTYPLSLKSKMVIFSSRISISLTGYLLKKLKVTL